MGSGIMGSCGGWAWRGYEAVALWSESMSDIRRSRQDTAAIGVALGIVLLSLMAVALSGYMWAMSARLHAQGLVGSLPGCPDTELISCGEVLISRYSQWRGLPLAAFGALNYGALLIVGVGLLLTRGGAAWRSLWGVGLFLAGIGTLAGVWLLIVQVVYIHKFCLLCDLTHAAGLISLILLLAGRPAEWFWPIGLRAGGLAVVSVAVLVGGQVLARPEVEVTRIVAGPASQAVVGTQPAATTQVAEIEPVHGFKVTDSAGTVIATLDLDEEIVLGDPEASRVLVEFMDFGCHECKQEFELMQEILKQHPKWFRVLILLFPRNKACNAYTGRERPNVCEVAEAAVALRKHGPEHYAQAHALFFKLQATPLTGGMAWELIKQMCKVDDAVVQSWQKDPTLLEKIKRHGEIVNAIVIGQQIKKTVSLPGLFANGKLITGAAETQAELEKHITQLIGSVDEAGKDDKVRG